MEKVFLVLGFMVFLTSNGDFVLLILELNVRTGLQTPSCDAKITL